jgi:23S rRNA pseudouridine1911/1915/1917 synthase
MSTPRTALCDGEHLLDGAEQRLDRAVREQHEGVSWEVVRRAIRSGKVAIDGQVQREPGTAVQGGQQIRVTMNAPREPKSVTKDAIVHVDRHVVVVRKPPGVATVPDERWRRNTLMQQVGEIIRSKRDRPVPLGVVQRLDFDTTGLLVFTRTSEAYELLKSQFKEREVTRSYLALVAGKAAKATYRSYLREHKNGKRSSTPHRQLGKYAVTHTEVVEWLTGATLIRCNLETGRTHQIRIHLAEADHPLLGDRRYFRRLVKTPPAPRVMLHAAELGFVHPMTQRPMKFEEPMPADMLAVLKNLR